jgi:hypothetical protein
VLGDLVHDVAVGQHQEDVLGPVRKFADRRHRGQSARRKGGPEPLVDVVAVRGLADRDQAPGHRGAPLAESSLLLEGTNKGKLMVKVYALFGDVDGGGHALCGSLMTHEPPISVWIATSTATARRPRCPTAMPH